MTEAEPTTQRLGIPYDAFCQECGYNLRGLTGDRCPECGHPLDDALSQESRIPWVHRDKLGTIRAYWKTVFWVGFKYKRFCEEINKPVDYKDSQRFRWLTILHAWVPMVAAGLVYVLTLDKWTRIEVKSDWGINANWLFGVFAVVTLPSLITLTGVPSYLFDTRKISIAHRNAAIAMSYYCCGSLNWTPFLWGFGIACVLLVNAYPRYEMIPGAGLMFVFFMTLAQVGDWWMNLSRTARRVMPQLKGRATLVALLTPVLWGASIVAVVACMAIPVALGLLIVVLVY